MTTKLTMVPVLLLITATFLMGSSFAVGKLGLHYFSPLLLTGYRFLLAGGLLLLIVGWFQPNRPRKAFIWRASVIGSLQTAGVMGCIFISLQYISAGESAILTFTNPLFVLILSTLFLKEKHGARQWAGVLIGIIGVSIVMSGDMAINQGTLIGLLGAVFWASATLLYKRWDSLHANTWLLSGMQMTFGGILLLLACLTGDTTQVWNGQSTAILLWLAIPGSIVQFGLWYILLSKMNPARASSFLFLAPVFGVLTGAWLLDEPLHPLVLLGGCCVFAGIYLSSRKPVT
jgi:probable blue pigment (indigoidine) exporter